MEALNLITLINDEEKKSKSSREKVRKTHTAELHIGICAPIGSCKELVIESLTNILQTNYDYRVEVIKLSKFIDKYELSKEELLPGKTEQYSKLMHKIKQGDEIRKKYSNASVLVELGIKQIFNERASEVALDTNSLPLSEEYKSRRVCYIIDSIKNKEELLLLREIYSDLFYLISVFSPQHERENNLRKKELSNGEIKSLIDTDEFENNSFGQNVRNTFTEADFFLRVSDANRDLLENKVTRLLHLIFDTNIVTPSPEENAMYAAKSVAGNSSCLSRQVGAAITDSLGAVISKGWNDVPKFGGNLYQDSDVNDFRCKTAGLGYCSNDAQKDKLVESIVDFIKNDPELQVLFQDDKKDFNIPLIKSFSSKIRTGKIKDLIEFSRSVHAEMHAIIAGSQLSGSKMVGGKLFCTTYPCHNCARHIIVAGIKEVYYIEPYVKSLCIELHSDAITENELDDKKVKILVYDGVAPRRYLSFFTNFVERKDSSGKMVNKDLKTIIPKMSLSLQALSTLEQQAIHSLEECGIT